MIQFLAALLHSIERAANIGVQSLRPCGMKGLGAFLTHSVQLLERLINPGTRLRGSEFGEHSLRFFPKTVTNLIQGRRSPRLDSCSSSLIKDLFHLLVEFTNQLPHGPVERGGG